MLQTYFRLLLICACGHLEKFITRNEDNTVNFVFSGQREFNMDKNRAPQCRGQCNQKDG